ncbi:CfrBI family restriction endonuclease [Candidatus Spongiihabitans sp.]|uniref:CfrBI family restriction endonuclease n=1 Tax=Candidatus Spongiihabitans sp. TaxID=3101308 RepID=UPI003C6FB81B
MTLTNHVIKNIVLRLLDGEDYRAEIVTLIDAEFMQFAVDFFRRVAEAKLTNQDIDVDWYQKEMLNSDLPSDEIIIHAGLNRKTIMNMHNTAKREIVIGASNAHYEKLCSIIEQLTKSDDLNLILQIKFNKVSVELDINESLIVINALAVKRAALRGGLWSTAGKQVEGPLMVSLCKLFDVPKQNYSTKTRKGIVQKGEVNREVDFFLKMDDMEYRCEVKLMGRGNPESADAVIARDSNVFIADKLSEQNKTQLANRGVEWVEMRSQGGYKKFGEVLITLGIPHTENLEDDISARLKKIFSEIFN